jgi:dephospho-CoA kinase
MRSFKEFCQEALQLDEKLITFGKKAYPKFGQIVILAGGAGSGKGYVNDTLLGIEGNALDVDALKALAVGSTKLSSKIKDETGLDIKGLDLSDAENVKTLHDVLADVYGITRANQQRVFSGVLAASADRKPNLIFDVTLKDLKKLDEKLISFGKKAYPKFGQIVILAGGAGSGKGYVNDTLLGIEGNVLDVDALKALAVGSTKLSSKIKDETGLDIKGLDLSDAENVKTLHDVLADVYGITRANQQRVFSGVLAAIRNKIRDYTPDTPTWD